MALGRGRENDFSRWRLAVKRHFFTSDKLKLQILRCRKSVNLGFFLSLRYLFLTLLKNDLGADEKAMFQDVRRLWKLILCLSTQPKSLIWCRTRKRFLKESHIRRNMFYTSWPLEYVICGRSRKRCFTWSLWIVYSFSSFYSVHNSTWTMLGNWWFWWSPLPAQ
jgi:hypothetical protein